MNPTKSDPKKGLPSWCGKSAFLVALATLYTTSFTEFALAGTNLLPSEVHRMPGGLVPVPVITSITSAPTNGLTINWKGWGGPYRIEQSLGLSSGTWDPVGDPVTNLLSLTVPQTADSAFFRVSGKAPNYVGASTCLRCHPDTHDAWFETRHAKALETLKAIRQDKNAVCLKCHTVGHGLPNGFVDEATTPKLAGVQCENCHGPGGDHARNPRNESIRPKVTQAGQMCGGCHSDAHHPTFEEWETTKHAEVNEHTADYFRLPAPTGEQRMNSCGACHSGAVRLTMLQNTEIDPLFEDPAPLPSGEEAASVGVTCAVCHDSHTKTANGSQLRNPTASLKPFSYDTSASKTFQGQYDPEVNLCGQCHNLRGGSWTSSGRPPHHSVQYNILIGNGGIEDGFTPLQSYHMQIEKQCAHCHTHAHPVQSPTEANPNFMGHDFKPHLNACLPCHTEEGADLFVTYTQNDIKARITKVKGLLDQWGTTKAPEALRTKYSALAWEFTNEGQLSNPTGDSTIAGPTSAEQASIPDDIKKARYNLYLIEHDASYGVHNADYARSLLIVAEQKVKALLAAP